MTIEGIFWILLFVFLVLLATISEIRIFLRSRLKSSLYLLIGEAILISGVIGIIINISLLEQLFEYEKLNICLIPFILLAIFGGMLSSIGFIFRITKESGIWKEIANRTSFLKRLVGNVPVIERNQYPPSLNKKYGIIIGILFIVIGCFGILWNNLKSNDLFSTKTLIAPLIFLIDGFLLIIFSIRKGEKGDGSI